MNIYQSHLIQTDCLFLNCIADVYINVIVMSVFLYCECLLESLFIVPAEKGVLYKERNSGAYRLSAYYFAKITSDLPLSFILPTVMYTSFFWMSGLGGPREFFLTYLVILLQVLVAQVD